MIKFTLEAPWYTFRKKVEALFGRDPDIRVGEVVETKDGKTDYTFDLEIRSHEKFIALDRVMPKVKTFGGVTLGICLYDAENSCGEDSPAALYQTIFEGNPLVKDIQDVSDFTGTPHCYVRFRPEVLQFFDDNTADFNGNWSGLAQDIAGEVFADEYRGVHFCTAGKDEPET